MKPLSTLLRLAFKDFFVLQHLWGLIFSLLVTLILFIAAAWGLALLLNGATLFTGWLAFMNPLLAWIGGGSLLLVGWFISPLFITAIAQLFLEHTAGQLTHKHYPHLAPQSGGGIWPALRLAGQSLWRSLAFNLIILPFIFITPLYMLLYLLLNARLFARDYAFMLLPHYLPTMEAEAVYTAHRKTLWRMGALIALGFMVPLINLMMPFLAVAMMVHGLCPVIEKQAALLAKPHHATPSRTAEGGL